MKPVSLFGQGIRSISDIITRQRRLNCFYSVRQDGDRSGVVVIGSPGSFIWVTLPQGPINAMRVVGSLLYVQAGLGFYSINFGGATATLGTLTEQSVFTTITDNGFDVTVVNSTNGYVYNIAGATFTKITDVNFPTGCGTICYLGERYIAPVPNSRQYRVSAQFDGTTWSPQIFATKEDYSDNILATDSFLGTLILWGSFSIEFWQNAGTSPNPFQKIVGASQTWGLGAIRSRSILGQTIAFLAQNPDGGIQVMRLSGLSVSRISTEDIENEIHSFQVYADAVALTYTVNGHSFYQLTFPSANRTFVYDSMTSVWNEGQTGLSVTGRHYATLGAIFNSNNYFSDSTTGSVYQFDIDSYTDNGQQIKREIATKHVRNAGNVIDVSELFLDMEVGVGNSSITNPQIAIQVSRNGGKTFGPQKIVTMGQIGAYLTRVIFRRLGSGRDFVFLITMTDPVKFVIASGSAVVESADD
jgi:hypothetical protein